MIALPRYRHAVKTSWIGWAPLWLGILVLGCSKEQLGEPEVSNQQAEARGTATQTASAEAGSTEAAPSADVTMVSVLKTAAPSASASDSAGGATVSGGTVENAAAVVAGMATGFRRCYQLGLQEDPNMKGAVRVTARIGPGGEVQSAVPSPAGGLSSTVVACVTAVVAAAHFSPPSGGGATLVVPVSFLPK